ncbi:phosphorylated adapter RNA export protein isoform X2 [Lissotriton helveticus]
MAEVEDGEISDSDSDMKVGVPAVVVKDPQEQKSFLNCTDQSVQNIALTLPSGSSYRTTKGAVSSDESASDSDDEVRSLWKRQKQVNLPPKPEPLPFVLGYSRPAAPPMKKMNNIWGSVLQDQSQDLVATELGILGMDGQLDMSRQSEAYNYILAKKLMEKEKKLGGEEMAILDKELDEYMNEEKNEDKKPANKGEENGHAHLKRKRPVKERLGERLEMDFKGRFEITEEDTEDKVADEIAFRLREPKKDLISKVVQTIGKKKAIELMMETAEVEENGGLFVMVIFHSENQKECESKKAAKKRRRHIFALKMKQAIKGINLQEHDDASRETFASDTNEALASLDDIHDGHVEMRVDPEDAIEIDHCQDLETF